MCIYKGMSVTDTQHSRTPMDVKGYYRAECATYSEHGSHYKIKLFTGTLKFCTQWRKLLVRILESVFSLITL